MTAITQKIRRFTGGISDQPDEQKIPGQVRDAVNCIPDVVQGLIKRPGLNLVNNLNTDQFGKWFFIDKENNFVDEDRYVGQIDNRDLIPNPDFNPDEEASEDNPLQIKNPTRGKVKVWDLKNGKLQKVCYADSIDPLEIDPTAVGLMINRKQDLNEEGKCEIDDVDEKWLETKYPCSYDCEGVPNIDPREEYFIADTEDDLQVLTINDYTFVTNRKKSVEMSANTQERMNPQGTIELRSIAGLTTYEVDVTTLAPPRDEDNASKLSVTATGTVNDPPVCSSDFEQLFTDQSGNKNGTGLTFRLITTSSVDDNDQCVYDHRARIVNGGTGWEVGETVTVVNGGVTYTITVDEINKPISVSTATKISAAGSGFDFTVRGGVFGGLVGGKCANTGTWEETNVEGENDGSLGRLLSYKLTTSAVTVPINPNRRNLGNNFAERVQQAASNVKCQYSTSVEIINGGEGWEVGDTFRRNYNGATYEFRIEEVSDRGIEESTDRISVKTDRENPQADDLLDGLQDQLVALGFEAKRIGNSIYLTRERPFTITTPNSILLRVLSSTNVGTASDPNYVVQANDISEVPLQTKHLLVFQIRNSFSDADDYYVQFQGDNEIDGTGTYKEVPKPGIPNFFLPSSMPHGILRLAETYKDDDGDIVRTFLVASFKWASRQAGDDLTVPRPSFAPEAGATFGRFINQLAFFRNRFVFLTDENVVCSVAGDFFNFWAKTAQAITPSDPIDLQVSNNYPAVLYGAQPTTAGLIVFSENAQFMLGTENDVLEPRTARTSILSTYNYNRDSNPISLGTTVGFVSGIGRYTRFYEMANISRDQEPEVVEQSKVVEQLIPGGFKFVGISKDNQLVAFGQPDTEDVWIFRYFNTGERRAQSSWVRWQLPGELVNHSLINDSYFSVIQKDGQVYLMRGDVRALQNTLLLEDEQGEDYRTFLDYAKFYNAVKLPTEKYTTFDISDFPIFDDLKLLALDASNGRILVPKISDGYMQLRGDFPDGVILGYTFKFQVDLPQFYVKKEANGQTDSWDTANVIIQRVKLNFGRIGYYKTILKRLGRDDYEQEYEAKPMDIYDANELAYLPDYEQTTPVYQRNTTFRMIIESEHPAPVVLYSATWEGQYQENYVKRL